MIKNKWSIPYGILLISTILLSIKADLFKGNLSNIQSYSLVALLCLGTSFTNAIIIKRYYGIKKALFFFLSLSSAIIFPYDPLNPGSLISNLHVFFGYYAFIVYAISILYHLAFYHYKKQYVSIYMCMLGSLMLIYMNYLSVVGLMEVIFLSINLIYFYLFAKTE